MAVAEKKYSKMLIGIALLIFLLVSFLSITQMNMSMGSNGQLASSDCPFMPGMTSLCNMSPLQHIAAWQSMFTAIPHQQSILAALLMLLASLAISLLLIRRATYPPVAPALRAECMRHRTLIRVSNPLQELFSNGILHPKIF